MRYTKGSLSCFTGFRWCITCLCLHALYGWKTLTTKLSQSCYCCCALQCHGLYFYFLTLSISHQQLLGVILFICFFYTVVLFIFCTLQAAELSKMSALAEDLEKKTAECEELKRVRVYLS